MRFGSILMIIFSIFLAVGAGLLAQNWLEQQRAKSQTTVVLEKNIQTGKVVIATQPLSFGTELTKSNLRVIDWPAGSIPAGAFSSISELLKANQRRVVLTSIAMNEPILKWKITGPGQRASLSAVIGAGMKAVTIRVNDVNGIAGFVLPGDRVDVLLTRIEKDPNDKNRTLKFNDIILQYVRVLGVDQLADDRTDKPTVVKAVTLEVRTEEAQRLTLAANVGNLSLALRPAGSTAISATERVTAEDLGQMVKISSTESISDANQKTKTIFNRNTNIFITRGIQRSEYNVPIEGYPVKAQTTLLNSKE